MADFVEDAFDIAFKYDPVKIFDISLYTDISSSDGSVDFASFWFLINLVKKSLSCNTPTTLSLVSSYTGILEN